MGSRTQPKIAFNENDLVELEWVLDSVCSALRSNGELDEDTKVYVRRRIFRLACNGISDPELLRNHLVSISKVRRQLTVIRD
jgi:hypothetical protein